MSMSIPSQPSMPNTTATGQTVGIIVSSPAMMLRKLIAITAAIITNAQQKLVIKPESNECWAL